MRNFLFAIILSLTTQPAWTKIQYNANKDLMTAIENREEKKALTVIKKFPIDGKYTGEQKMTHLMMAALHGQTAVVEALLAKKVPLELKNEVGDTALAVAVGNEQIKIAQKLIAAGAKMNVSCGDPKSTLLMCAVQVNALDLIKTILKTHPKEKFKKNSEGQTASDIAHEVGTTEAQMLLK